MTKVTHVLQDKAHHEIYTIRPEATVLEAISLMAEKGIAKMDLLTEEEYLDITDALPADNQHLDDEDPNNIFMFVNFR